MPSYIKTILILFAASSCWGCQAENEEYKVLFKCSNKIHDAYGICTHINVSGPRYEYDTREIDLSMINNTGASFVRTDWYWHQLMKSDGKIMEFTHYDSMMVSIKKHRKQVLGILTVHKTPDYYDEWQYYVEQTVRRYRNDVKYWEVINEAHFVNKIIPGFNVDNYVDLLKRGYTAVKKSNKKAKVLITSTNVYANFIDSVFANNVNNYFDIMNIHCYTSPESEPEEFIESFRRLKLKMDKYHVDKPVWITETGASTKPGCIDERTQAQRLPRIFLISFACGVDKVFWYNMRSREMNPDDDNDYYGLTHANYACKPSFYAYQVLTRMCPQKSIRPQIVRSGKVFLASWKRPDGLNVWAFWTSKNNEKVHFCISGDYEIYDEYGNAISYQGDFFMASPAVTYLVGAQKVIIDKIG